MSSEYDPAMSSVPNVIEHYQEHRPLRSHKRTVERALASIPPDRLEGLEKISLRDWVSLTPGERRKRLIPCQAEILLNVLFHEVAHHVQAVRLQRKTLWEEEAERIGFELARASFKKRHPLLVPWARLFRRLVNWARRSIAAERPREEH